MPLVHHLNTDSDCDCLLIYLCIHHQAGLLSESLLMSTGPGKQMHNETLLKD
jgi:hypothetical protein